jgi:hypothetical protein
MFRNAAKCSLAKARGGCPSFDELRDRRDPSPGARAISKMASATERVSPCGAKSAQTSAAKIAPGGTTTRPAAFRRSPSSSPSRLAKLVAFAPAAHRAKI